MAAAATSREQPPNVLFIAIDDLRPELGAYGSSEVHSPNIDRLASEGILFERAYCQYPVCGPSRASVLTGLRPDTTGIYENDQRHRASAPEAPTLPESFRKAGYQTAALGKVDHAGHHDEPSWTASAYRIPFRAQSTYRDPETLEYIASRQAEGKAMGLSGRALRRYAQGPFAESYPIEDDAYPDGKIASDAIERLESFARSPRQPFFLAVGFLKPHEPFIAPKKYWDLYDRDKLSLAANPSRPEKAPAYAFRSLAELRNAPDFPDEGDIDEALARKMRHAYFACISYVDAQVGRLIDSLDQLGLADNTIVILWGDHGFHLGELGHWAKHTTFEFSARAPLIFKAPDQPQGLRVNQLVEFVDIYPTLCRLAGIKIPHGTQGKSLWDPVALQPWQGKDFALTQIYRKKENIMGRSLRAPRYRYTQWREESTGELLASELYDHELDPGETRNKSGESSYSEIEAQLRADFERLWAASLAN